MDRRTNRQTDPHIFYICLPMLESKTELISRYSRFLITSNKKYKRIVHPNDHYRCCCFLGQQRSYNRITQRIRKMRFRVFIKTLNKIKISFQSFHFRTFWTKDFLLYLINILYIIQKGNGPLINYYIFNY